MSKIFKPRRGKFSVMKNEKPNLILEAGEMFVEFPDTGIGTGSCKIKFGDGTTIYENLPVAIGGDIADTEIQGSITEDTSTTAQKALQNVTTSKTLGNILGSLRRACQLNAENINTLNTNLNNKVNKSDYKWNSGLKSANAVTYGRVGNVVCIYGRSGGSPGIPASNYVTVGNVPNGYRPAWTVQFPVMSRDQNIKCFDGYVYTGGNVDISANGYGCGYWNFCATYPIVV